MFLSLDSETVPTVFRVKITDGNGDVVTETTTQKLRSEMPNVKATLERTLPDTDIISPVTVEYWEA